MKFLWSGEYDPVIYEAFEKYGEVVSTFPELPDNGNVKPPRIGDEDEMVEALKGVDVWIAGYDDFTEGVLKRCPDLKLILSVRDGADANVDCAACEKAGVPVYGANGRCAVSVAEMTMALCANLARPIVPVTNMMRGDIKWTGETNSMFRSAIFSATELYEKVMGIVGLGRNGRQLAKIAQGYGMRVIAYDPFVDAETMKTLDIEKFELLDLMKTADYICPQVRLTKENEKLISAECIAAMKPTACIVNTARGKLIDEVALIKALKEDKIGGAALDVFDPEPNPNRKDPDDGLNPEIYDIPVEKLIITPHMAGFSQERAHHQSENVYKAFLEFLKGNKPAGLQTRGVFESPNFAERGGKLFGVEK